MEAIRSVLYPLGFLATTLFSLRFLVQWIQSERKKESYVPNAFWYFSLAGNSIMALHALIQLQYPLSLIQGLNGVIAWRNLDLKKENPKSRVQTFLVVGLVLSGLSTLFFMQGIFQPIAWMRAPKLPITGFQVTEISSLWHVAGFFAMILFASRFWIQWWMAEKKESSFLGESFWWMSLVGALFSLCYFIRLGDIVNILGYSIGILPYIRNLMLLKKERPALPKREGAKSIFLFAGEQSGDMLGGRLISSIRKMAPTIEISGVGGLEMTSQGMKLFSDIKRFEVMGLSAVLKKLPTLYGEFQKIKSHILKENPSAVVFIDYPDFNMKMAKALKKSGYKGKLIHYVSPSIWAWRKNRIKPLSQSLDLLLTILPFEADLYKKTKLPVSYVGHPLVSAVDSYTIDATWKEKVDLPKDKPILAIFPGSRKEEIQRNLPLQIAAAKSFEKEFCIAVSSAKEELNPLIKPHLNDSIKIVPYSYRYELMKEAKGAIATSGTVVLELGLFATPTVITYQLSPFNYFLGRYVIRVNLPFYTLVNIICKKKVFPEFIHKDLSSKEISEALKKMLEDREGCIKECQNLRTLLETHDASQKAASQILEILQ